MNIQHPTSNILSIFAFVLLLVTLSFTSFSYAGEHERGDDQGRHENVSHERHYQGREHEFVDHEKRGRHEEHEVRDSLYIGTSSVDGDAVRRFDAKTGKYLGDFVPPGDHGLLGPRGLIFTKGSLYLVNQNVDTDFAGEVFRYNRDTAKFIDAVVDRNDPNPPFGPRGMIRGKGETLYIADLGGDSGAVKKYDLKTGKFLGDFDITGFNHPELFYPRGIVQGPDGLIYVSVFTQPGDGDGLKGYVLRFNRHGKFVDEFPSHTAAGCAVHLHRPEGLVFGPDEKLYITAFRANPSDNDKILVFDIKKGECVDKIDLAQPTMDAAGVDHPENRAYGQALLFGPNGRLFVPITGGAPYVHSGEVRSYNVKNKTYKVIIPAFINNGPLEYPWYLTFGKTDPRTLEYND